MRAAESRNLEYAVKASFLYKFGDYVRWPLASFPSDTTPVVLCVVGDDPFGRTLDDATNGEHIGMHPITVRRSPAVVTESGCNILFTRGSAAQSVANVLKAVAGQPVLTITETIDEGPRGIINFAIRDNRVRFEIDEQTATTHQLEISSKLLSLAVAVRRDMP